MPGARLRFYAELNDFLPPARRQTEYEHALDGAPSAKEVIESQGVPHSEVDVILANGASVDFSYRVREGDRISVYPVFESFDVSTVVRVRPRPLREPRFVLDGCLGKLARYLRLAGFDAVHDDDPEDGELVRRSREERRILLARDPGLVTRGRVTHGYCVRRRRPRLQLVEVLRRFDLAACARPLSRCVRCNGETRGESRACAGCGRVLRRGSRRRRMERFIAAVLAATAEHR